MNPTPEPAPVPPRRPRGAWWILAGLGLLFLSWLLFMGWYLWQVRHRPPPGEPPARIQPAPCRGRVPGFAVASAGRCD